MTGGVAVFDLIEQPGALVDLWFQIYGTGSDPVKSGITVHRFNTGFGQVEGGISTVITNNDDKPRRILYLEVVPWIARLFMHTMRTVVVNSTDSSPLPVEVTQKIIYTPAKDRQRPAMLEMEMLLPAHSKTIWSIEYLKGWFMYTEFPPDPNRGFDLPYEQLSSYDCAIVVL